MASSHSKNASHLSYTHPKEPLSKELLFFNRELSWLDFNARVLSEALNSANPLLERLKFLAIFSNNLDEFFMIYLPGMRERADENTGRVRTEAELHTELQAIKAKLEPMIATQYRCFRELMPELAQKDVKLQSYQDLTDEQRKTLALYFEDEVFPVLTPLAVDPGHPFPYISNLSLSLAIVVSDPITGEQRFARIKVPEPPVLARLVRAPGKEHHFVLLEEVIAAHMARLFPGMELRASYPFRITRNADLEIQENDIDDLLELVEEELTKRRFGEIERIEFTADTPEDIRSMIITELKIDEVDVYTIDGPLNIADFFVMAGLDVPDLRYPPFTPLSPPALNGQPDMFAAIRQNDILLHHPYQSFGCVTDFIRSAADDPAVLTIKHTLYRTSGDSPILEALIDAAEAGKQVACLVEIKARFDEANNINWAKQLEKSGVHVVYGLIGLKTHCKVTLIVRREESGLRRYLHVGTGNYNPKTATSYTDIGLLTCAPEFGVDATELFNFLTGYSRQKDYRRFLVAPLSLRPWLHGMIERETKLSSASSPGRIIAKMNALVDQSLIQDLYVASQAGVQIDLIVRGMCCLRPGVPGLSDNIRVISIVGRFLEHSRIFYFQNAGEAEVYIGSADWMPRNLDRRVEVVVPVMNPDLRRVLHDEVLTTLLEDNTQAWDLHHDGCYERRHPAPGQPARNAQQLLLERLT